MAKANKVCICNSMQLYLLIPTFRVKFSLCILSFQVEFRCELSPKQVMVWVEKDTKAKEVEIKLYSFFINMLGIR